MWRHLWESNPSLQFCRLLPNRSAKAPLPLIVSDHRPVPKVLTINTWGGIMKRRINIMFETQYDIAQMRYERFEKYIEEKRINLAPALGADACDASSIPEASVFNDSDFELKTSERTNPSQRYIAEIVLAKVVNLADYQSPAPIEKAA